MIARESMLIYLNIINLFIIIHFVHIFIKY